ncbi:solute carrier family 35 member B1-like [Varroa jacobsoni]|uniref:solute carrier family 35 member B1-like n=1 Tax=Varroa jacobsoni TaxID=62625 RepID=UPI000BF4E274|nr:solute carrier family 35 member B1-like [Varroa jacobsoni]
MRCAEPTTLIERKEESGPGLFHSTKSESGAVQASKHNGVPKMSSSSSLKVVIYAGGILISYAVFGIFQEKILRSSYGKDEERFVYQFSLLLIQCAMNMLMSKVLLHAVWSQGRDLTEWRYYTQGGIFYVGAMVTSFIALQYVNYPTQVVAKSCKPIPVMILGVLLARKRYPIQKYLFVVQIVVGAALFMYEDTHCKADKGSFFGNMLLAVSLALDGLLAATQDRMKQNFQTKSLHMMFHLNLVSIIFLTICVAYTGELPAFAAFLQKYPQLYGEVFLFAVCSAVGQIFIYSTVAEFGPLVCSIVTTTRKLFTVIASILLFGNALTERQWLGTSLVFAGLFLDGFFGKSSDPAKKA